MNTRDQVAQAVFTAVDRLNELLPAQEELPKDETVPISGSDGQLSSLHLANLIVLTEEQLDSAGRPVSLLGRVVGTPSALATLGSFIDYIAVLLRGSL